MLNLQRYYVVTILNHRLSKCNRFFSPCIHFSKKCTLLSFIPYASSKQSFVIENKAKISEGLTNFYTIHKRK